MRSFSAPFQLARAPPALLVHLALEGRWRSLYKAALPGHVFLQRFERQAVGIVKFESYGTGKHAIRERDFTASLNSFSATGLVPR